MATRNPKDLKLIVSNADSPAGKGVTGGGVFWVFEHPRNFREKLDTQNSIRY